MPPKTKVAKENDIQQSIADSFATKPEKLICADLHWKFGIRAVLRGENLMITGPTGTGKDLFVSSLVTALGRKSFYIPFGATQDPRSSIVGNTHYSKDKGTYNKPSLFVRAIQIPNAVIILDELTRAHPEVQNILMTVLDRDKRWLRIDEDPETPTIEVAEGVSFLATANIGAEYLTTRGLDRAFLDRWSILEMRYLSRNQEAANLKLMYPTLNASAVDMLVNIAGMTRDELEKDSPVLDTALSTRAVEEMAALVEDGFTVDEAIEIKAYPLYSSEGNPSPRQSFRQLIQAFLPDAGGRMGNVAANDPDALI